MDEQVVPCAHRSVGEEDARPDEDFSRLEQRIAEAAERREAAQKQFNRLCSICIAAQQARPLSADRTSLTSPTCACMVDLSGCSPAEALNGLLCAMLRGHARGEIALRRQGLCRP